MKNDMIYPSLASATKLSKKYNRIPVYRELNLSSIQLLSLVKSLQADRDLIFLESAKENKKWSRFSFLGLNPKKEITFRPPYVIEKKDSAETRQEINFYSYLKEEAGRYSSPNYKRFGDFNGGLVGYFGFELVNYTGILRKKIKEDDSVPLALLVQIDDFIVYDNKMERLFLATCIYPYKKSTIEENYSKALQYLEDSEKKILSLIEKTIIPYLPSQADEINLNFRYIPEEHKKMVTATKDLIASGEAIQSVISMRADINQEIDPYSFYLKLRSLNPSPYMFFLKFDELYVVGSSPEVHVKVTGNIVDLKPIAGTIAQGKNRKEKAKNRLELFNDPKERAEHLMLVDLARNDLGRIAASGSVRVIYFMRPEDYSHVIHLVSLVRCTLSEKKDMIDVLRETFPAGTVSGAPKVRALEIIDEMEKHPRNIYAGAIGYIGYNGFLDTCITIRTAVFSPQGNYLQAGGGIVYDSVPEKEYTEIQNKLKALAISLRYARKKEAN